MPNKIITVNFETMRQVDPVTGEQVGDGSWPRFVENSEYVLSIFFVIVSGVGGTRTVTPKEITADSFQYSITERADWDDLTPPLIRKNLPANFNIIDAAGGNVEVTFSTTTQPFRDYLSNNEDAAGAAPGGQEFVVFEQVGSAINDSVQDAGGITAGATQVTITDASAVLDGMRLTFDDSPNSETVIVTGVDTGTNTITFTGNGTGNGTIYSHANATPIIIIQSIETPWLQDNCNLQSRRDLGGQEPDIIDPGYLTAAETIALVNARVEKDLSNDITYPELTDLPDDSAIYVDNEGAPSKILGSVLKAVLALLFIPVVSPAVAGNLPILKIDGTLEDSGTSLEDLESQNYPLLAGQINTIDSLDVSTENAAKVELTIYDPLTLTQVGYFQYYLFNDGANAINTADLIPSNLIGSFPAGFDPYEDVATAVSGGFQHISFDFTGVAADQITSINITKFKK